MSLMCIFSFNVVQRNYWSLEDTNVRGKAAKQLEFIVNILKLLCLFIIIIPVVPKN